MLRQSGWGLYCVNITNIFNPFVWIFLSSVQEFNCDTVYKECDTHSSCIIRVKYFTVSLVGPKFDGFLMIGINEGFSLTYTTLITLKIIKI
jgi:hypothetical protein